MKKFTIFLTVFCILFLSCNKTYSIQRQNQNEKLVYLTFDDGPSPVTSEILKILKENKIKATFFVIGKNVEKYPEILRQTATQGHKIGIHSYTHEYKSIYKSADTLKEDITLCYNAIKKVLPSYKYGVYRYPGGSFFLSEELLSVTKEFNLSSFDWNASCRDCELKNYTPKDLCDEAIKTSLNRKKIILLSHDASTKTRTALALQSIIDYYRSQGYSFKSL